MSEQLLPRNFEDFRESIEAIKDGAGEYVGGGSESYVWRAILDDEAYAIKISQPLSPRGKPRDTFRATQGAIDVGIRALGITGLEQIVAGNPEEGAAIYSFAPGVNLAKVSSRSEVPATEEQREQLYETIKKATEVDIEFDWMNTYGSNAFYCVDSGFTLIDYWKSFTPLDAELNRSNAIKSLGPVAMRLLKDDQQQALLL